MKPRILIVQRISLSHGKLKSRSIGARFGPLFQYMSRHQMLEWEMILETEITDRQLERFDVVLLNKHSSIKGLEIIERAQAKGVKTIYDMDDWILDLPSYSVTNLDEDVLENVVRMLRAVDVVTVSTARLQERLRFLRPDAILLSNGFDHEGVEYDHAQQVESTHPKILFSNTDGIKLVRHRKAFFEQLIAFQNKYPTAEIDFWGDQFLEMLSIPSLKDKGFLDNYSYKQSIRDAGYWFAIVPLGGQEDEVSYQFNTCKSHIKFIDYASLGIPGIYSNTPVYNEVVKHGATGLLVDNQDDHWQSALETMINSHKLRQTIRDNAYKFAIEKCGLAGSAVIFMDAIAI